MLLVLAVMRPVPVVCRAQVGRLALVVDFPVPVPARAVPAADRPVLVEGLHGREVDLRGPGVDRRVQEEGARHDRVGDRRVRGEDLHGLAVGRDRVAGRVPVDVVREVGAVLEARNGMRRGLSRRKRRTPRNRRSNLKVR